MSSVAAKLRSLYEAEESDHSDAELSAEGRGKKRSAQQSATTVTADLDGCDAASLLPKEKRRLRLRQDIPMLVPGSKVSRKDSVLGHSLNKNLRDEASFNEEEEDSLEEEESAEEEGSAEEEEEGSALSEASTEANEEEDSGSESDEKSSVEAEDEENGTATSTSTKSKSSSLNISKSLEKQYQEAMNTEKMEAIENAKRRKLDANRGAEINPMAVKNQLKLLRQIETFRIHLEPCLKALAGLPSSESASYKEIEREADETLKTLLRLQKCIAPPQFTEALLKTNDTRKISSDGGNSLVQKTAFSTSYFSEVADSVSRSLDPSSGKNSFKVLDQSIGSQVEAAFRDGVSWKSKVHPKTTQPIERDNAVESTTSTINKSNQILDLSTYDDKEFYMAMLQDIVSGGKAAGLDDDDDANDEEERNNETLRALQSKRALKKEKSAQNADYERRASKGRKIRYVLIEKLANFMASEPRPYDEEFPEEAVDGLMKSLFKS